MYIPLAVRFAARAETWDWSRPVVSHHFFWDGAGMFYYRRGESVGGIG